MNATPAELIDGTKLRLLESAGQIFADRGYRATTIRTICADAQANVSAVKYHFVDKRGLYLATLKYAIWSSEERYPYTDADDEKRPPPERLRAIIRLLMRRILDPARPRWHGRLLVRELLEPAVAADLIAGEFQRNWVERILRILRALLGDGPPEAALRDAAYAIIGQCTFYQHAKHYLKTNEPRRIRSAEDIDDLADRIFDYTIAALSGDQRLRDSGSNNKNANTVK